MTDEPVVVIGSGPTGAVAAARLVERGLDVVMLDAGDAPPGGLLVKAAGNTVFRARRFTHYREERADAQTGPNAADPSVMWISSHSLGGLSNYWTAAVPRFAPQDFHEGGRLDGRYVWPVTYDDLEPYYEMAERHLTVTAGDPIDGVPPNVLAHEHRLPDDWRRVAERASADGVGLGSIPMAKGEPWMIARRGSEFSSYHCVVAALLDRPNFELRPRSKVTRLSWSSQLGRVDAVDHVDPGTGRRTTQRARAVVLAAGTIDTTMILLRSTSRDFPTGLGNSNDVLGRYLHDHPREWWPATLSRPMSALAHPAYLARAPFETSDPLMGTSHTFGLASGRERLRTFYRGRTRRIGVQVFGTMVPDPDHRVELADDAASDASSARPRLTMSYDDRAVANIVSSRRRFRDVLGAAGLDVDVSGPFHELMPGSSVHLAGTVRMHADPRYGVVDGRNRMHDVGNVVVCDLGCFTTNPEKNPTLTAMALAIRSADLLVPDAE